MWKAPIVKICDMYKFTIVYPTIYRSGTRQFTDKAIHRHGFWRQFTDRFEDSSSTLLKTVHRHFFYHVIDIWLENVTVYCKEILMCYDLRWYVDIICWESDILLVWLIINRQTFDCYMKLYWRDPVANHTLFLMKFASNSKHSFWIFKQIYSGLPFYFYIVILR